MSCYLVQETDGTSRFTLEDGTGFLLLEFCPQPPGPDVGAGGPEMRGRRRRRQRMLADEEEIISILMGEL